MYSPPYILQTFQSRRCREALQGKAAASKPFHPTARSRARRHFPSRPRLIPGHASRPGKPGSAPPASPPPRPAPSLALLPFHTPRALRRGVPGRATRQPAAAPARWPSGGSDAPPQRLRSRRAPPAAATCRPRPLEHGPGSLLSLPPTPS